MSDKASREGNGYLARFYRHKDEVMGGVSVEEAMASRPQVGPGVEAPKEWQEFLMAAHATHKSMSALKDASPAQDASDKIAGGDPQDVQKALYDAAIADVDRFGMALKAWMAKRST